MIKNILRKNYRSLPFLLPLLIILLAYVVYPNLQMAIQSFQRESGYSINNYTLFFSPSNPANLEALWGSVYLSLLSVLFSAIIGVPLAYLFTFYDFPGKKILESLAILPIVMPPLIGVLAFFFLVGESGILPRFLQALFGLQEVPFSIKGFSAIVIVHAYSFYVYFYLFTANALKSIDASILEASKNLGASRLATLTKVLLPMLTPALGGASLLVFMSSMASFSAPFIFGGKTRILSLEIYNTKLNGNLGLAITQSVILAGISIGFLILLRYFSDKRQYAGGGKGVRIQPKAIKNRQTTIIVGAIGALLVGALALPHLVIILISFVKNGTWTWQILPPSYTLKNYINLFQDPRVFQPIANSLKMAFLATVANIIFGVAAAYMLVRLKPSGGKIIEALVMLPWAIPGTVLAIALIVTFNRPTIVSGGQILTGTFWILPLAYFIRNIPLVFRSTYAAFEQFDPSLEESARNLGAGAWLAFRRVIFPQIAPGILSGSLLAFVLALGEFVSSILLYNFSNKPISVEVVSQLRVFNLGSAAAYSVFLILLIAMTTALSNTLKSNSGKAVI